MNKYIIGIGSFIIGAVVGAIGTRTFLKTKYEALVEEEIASVKEVFSMKVAANVREVNAVLNEAKTTAEPKTTKISEKVVPIANPYEVAKQKYNLIRTAEVENTDSDSDDEEEPDDEEIRDAAGFTESELQAMERPTRADPYIISEQQYVNECPQYDKDTLYYYLIDSSLCDENEDLVDDIAKNVGDALSHFNNHCTTVWVRNESRSIDYEIISLPQSYSEVVCGIAPVAKSPRDVYEENKKAKTTGAKKTPAKKTPAKPRKEKEDDNSDEQIL